MMICMRQFRINYFFKSFYPKHGDKATKTQWDKWRQRE